MTKPKINDNGIDRDMTAEEIEAYSQWIIARRNEDSENEAIQTARLAARQSALEKLGLTADEVAALFG